MSAETRERLARIVRAPSCDLAEAALLCCAEIEYDLDIDLQLLRVDAIADGLRTSGYELTPASAAADALGRYLAGDLNFVGDVENYGDPANSLFTMVLDRRRGLPITLSILYEAVASRVGIPAFGIAAPGHFVLGVGSADDPIVVDPFAGGAILDEDALRDRVRSATGGAFGWSTEYLRPAPAPAVVRRLLTNMTRDFIAVGDAENALWTIELKQLLPGSPPSDMRDAGELLIGIGRYRDAANALEDYLEQAEDAADAEEVTRIAARARAKMN